MPETDPFRHHPELRDLVIDPETSFFRAFTPAAFDAILAANPGMPDIRMPDAEREACRRRTLAQRPDGDLWIFAYGSLMWDPALRFTEVRRARVDGYERRFCLRDEAARGTPEAPALMAGLARGTGCDGIAFRLAETAIATETTILWNRERIGPGYTPAFLPADTAHGPLQVVTFLADAEAPNIDLSLSLAAQARLIATARGILGSSMDYLENIASHFAAMEIADAEITALLADARRIAAESGAAGSRHTNMSAKSGLQSRTDSSSIRSTRCRD